MEIGMSRMNLGASVKAASEKAFAAIIESKELAAAIGGALGERARSGLGAAIAAGAIAAAIAMPAGAQEAPQQKEQAPQASIEAAVNPKSASSVLAVKTQEEFDNIVLRSSKPVVLILKTDWCPVCKRLAKVSKAAAAKGADGFLIVEVDADKSPAIYNKWRGKLNAIPQVQVVSGGKRTAMGIFVGGMDAGEFAAYLAKAREAEGRVAVGGSEGPAAGKALAAASEQARKPEARQAQKPVEPRAEGKAPKRQLLTIKTVEDFEEMVLGSKIPVVVIFKNDDSISSNRMVKKAMKALQAPGPAYALALVDANCADEEVHETWAAYSSYPELMAFSGGEQWDMDQVFNAGELSESQYGEYVALLAKVSAPPAAKPKEGAKPKTRSM